MTTSRPEIILEGSNNQQNWTEYSFRYKPGNLHRGLPLVAPYQPRLDWQMWFAALGSYRENSWVASLVYRLLLNETSVIALLDPSPFPKPPKYIRAELYNYTFSTPFERSKNRRRVAPRTFGNVVRTSVPSVRCRRISTRFSTIHKHQAFCFTHLRNNSCHLDCLRVIFNITKGALT